MRRLRTSALLLLALAGLAGCSGTRLAYNNAEIAVHWMADDYFALEGTQDEDFRARLARFHAWHRGQELPRYSALAASAGEKLASGLTQQELQWAWDSVLARYRRLAEQAAPDLAAVLVTLTPQQFGHMQQEFADSNSKFIKKYIKGSAAQQRERRAKRNLDLLREWVGELSGAQEAQLTIALDRLPLLYELRLQNRQRRQQEFATLLKAHRSAAELEPGLRHWLVDWEQGATPEYLRLSRLYRERYMQMLLTLDRDLAPEQRAHAVARFAQFGETFAALAGEGKLALLSTGGTLREP